MKWLVTIASVLAIVASLASIFFALTVGLPSIADVQAETKQVLPDMGQFWIILFAKEALTIFVATMAMYLSWKK
jgi:hypothetical protein